MWQGNKFVDVWVKKTWIIGIKIWKREKNTILFIYFCGRTVFNFCITFCLNKVEKIGQVINLEYEYLKPQNWHFWKFNLQGNFILKIVILNLTSKMTILKLVTQNRYVLLGTLESLKTRFLLLGTLLLSHSKLGFWF